MFRSVRLHKASFSALILSIVLLICGAGPAVSAGGAEVLGLRFGHHGDKIRVVLDLSQRVSGHNVFTLSSPDRIVIDLPRVARWHGPITASVPAAQGGPISAYRSGRFDADTVRIVLDSQQALIPGAVFSMLPQDGKQYRLVIDLTPESGDLMRASPVPPASDAQVAEAPVAPIGETAAQTAQSAPRPEPSPRTDAIETPLALLPVPAPKPSAPAVRAPRPATRLIVLDAGHGGVDPGAIAIDGQYEKTIALNMARRLRDVLNESGRYRVVMTRDSDVYIPLRERVAIARRAGADLFISLHADSINRAQVRGASVYTLSETASDKEAERLAARENRSDIIAGVDLAVQQDEVAGILLDLAMRDTKNQSKRLANMLVASFGDHDIDLLRNPHRYAGFAVLKAPDVPSVLVELGYLSNRTEAKLLRRSGHQSRLAEALAGGIDAYFARLAMVDGP